MLPCPITLSCPSKTFLLGEYLALEAGPCVLVTTEPRFELSVREHAGLSLKNIHPDSPAGQFIQSHFTDLAFEFIDPYQGLGGFGASSAQFLLAFAFYHGGFDFSPATLLQAYLAVAYQGEGRAPSGADLIAQWHGSFTHYDKARDHIETCHWPFESYQFALCHTQQKLATHEHLRALDNLDSHALRPIVETGIAALQSGNASRFGDAIRAFQAMLSQQQLTARHTQALLAELDTLPGVVAAKGCGAMGADVIFIFYEADAHDAIKAHCQTQGLRWIASQDNLASGATRISS